MVSATGLSAAGVPASSPALSAQLAICVPSASVPQFSHRRGGGPRWDVGLARTPRGRGGRIEGEREAVELLDFFLNLEINRAPVGRHDRRQQGPGSCLELSSRSSPWGRLRVMRSGIPGRPPGRAGGHHSTLKATDSIPRPGAMAMMQTMADDTLRLILRHLADGSPQGATSLCRLAQCSHRMHSVCMWPELWEGQCASAYPRVWWGRPDSSGAPPPAADAAPPSPVAAEAAVGVGGVVVPRGYHCFSTLSLLPSRL
jgi:hypothetical protein